jgi:16S rRNA (uracil1498-N3)-methyltransferase
MARLWRVYEPAAGDAGSLVLSAAETHHVRRVLRLGPGDRVAVFDGRGREWSATIESYAGDAAQVRLEAEIFDPIEPALELSLYQACDRAERMDWVVQKGTELGLVAVFALDAGRHERGGAGERRLARWRRIAVEAAKQSGRRRVPHVAAAAELPAAPDGVLALVLDPGAGGGIARICGGRAPERAWLAVGPEGGFTHEQVESAAAAGWRRARLGPRILRTETAGLVAAALLFGLAGDLG